MEQIKKCCRAVRALPTPRHLQHPPNTPQRQGPGNPARYPMQTASPFPKKAFMGESLKNELERKRQKNLKSFAP